MKYYLHIKEEITMDELSEGFDPQVIHLEVTNKGEAISLLAQYEAAFIARGKYYIKEFQTNRHAERLPCIKEPL